MFESSDKQRVADILLQCLLILFIGMDCSTDTKSKGKDLVVFACICDETALLFICRMDGNSCFKLEIRIVAPNCRGSWYSLDKFVDADFTNFKDLVDEVVDKCPPSYGHIVKIFYSCMDSKANIEICSDQDLVEMFAKHKASKCCYLTFC